jgi:hypothetical protein
LAMSVGAQINRHVVDKERHVRSMISIKASQKVLVRLPGAA